tara:strand:+ start:131 stop:565 length:435 start_codon:yes stop_codon:yes gene_type:complete
MSAYQVDTDCLGRVLKAISKVGVYGPRYKEIQKLKDAYNKNAGKVFDKLLELNRYSLNERYGDNGKKYVEELFFDVNKSKAVWLSEQLGHNDYQLVKSLDCFLYQACEGDAVKKSLYKTLVEIQNNFNGSLVNEHPQYQEVKWG